MESFVSFFWKIYAPDKIFLRLFMNFWVGAFCVLKKFVDPLNFSTCRKIGMTGYFYLQNLGFYNIFTLIYDGF